MALAVLAPTCSGSDITSAVFGKVRDVMPAAFGDFDSDELTDMFVTRNDGHTLEVMLASDQEPFLRSNETLRCTFRNDKIFGVVPGDFDGDALMDVMVTSKTSSDFTRVYIMWGGMHHLNCSSDEQFLFEMNGEPLAIDYNGDMIIDLFGMDKDRKRMFWQFHKNRTFTKIPLEGDHPYELRIVHSHAFLDVNGDYAPDLVLTGDRGLEFWFAESDGSFKLNQSLAYPKQLKQKNRVGQTLFLDVSMKGSEDILLPGCTTYSCDKSKIYVRGPSQEWCDLHVNFKDPSGKTWGFNNEVNEPYTDTITLRGGDFNMDGYPDLLASLKQQPPDPPLKRSFLLKNVASASSDCAFNRTFEVQWSTLEPMNDNTNMAVFYDFGQDGTLDVLFVHKDESSGKYGVSVFKNSLDYDANFMKVMVLTGLTNSETPPRTSALNRKKVKTFGSNLPGPSISYRTQTQEGTNRVARSSQLPQSAHCPLGLPYSIFGLGRTPNFIESLTVGLTGKSRDWTQIIPNLQMLVIPVNPVDPSTWKAQLFVTPSKLVLMSVAALFATCSVITLIILALYWKERRQDKREKLQEAHRFHFDAM